MPRAMPIPGTTRCSDGRHVLVLFFASALCLWLFVLVAGAVAGGESQQFDRWLLQALRSAGDLSDPIGPQWLEEGVRDVTALGGTPVLTLVVIAVVGLLALLRRPRTIAFLVLAVIGGLLLSLALKDLFGRPRPDFLPHGQRVYTASFPSGHSMNSAVVVTTLVGLSRVYLGVHWPTDVLAGWAAGAAWAGLCWLLMHAMQVRHVVEAEISDTA